MAGVPDNGGDLDSAGVYFMTVEEFESRSERETIRESQSSEQGDPSGSDSRNSDEEVDGDPDNRRSDDRKG
jgi:hypothetical protein